MKRNLLAAILFLLVFMIIGVAFAMDSIMPDGIIVSSDSDVFSDSSDASFTALDSSSDSDAKFLKEPSAVSKETLSAINSVVSKFDSKALTLEDYVTIESYINFHLTHTLSESETKEVNALLENGTPMGTIHDIYDFYLTTNEDFSIIAKIASYEDKYWGKNWIENAYNDITENKHGVIEAEDASAYLEKFEVSEILYANVLSRKGKYTIDEILENHYDGKSWNDITGDIYSSHSLQKLTGSEKERQAFAEYLCQKTFDYDSAPFEVYEFAFLSAKNSVVHTADKIDRNYVLENQIKLRETVHENRSLSSDKILKILDISSEIMTPHEYHDYYYENYEKAKKSGLTENEIELLEQKGFTMGEISSGVQRGVPGVQKLVQHIKSRRGGMLK